MNKVILIGRLGQDPELKNVGESVVANVSLATSERKKVNGEWTDAVEWHRCSIWGRQAENVAKYCSKGSQVAIEGRIQTRSYDKDGEKRYTTEIIVDRVEFVGGKPESKGDAYEPAAKPAGPAPAMVDDGLDDPLGIPF